ncbi:hypothetical protein QYE76_029349 [Lolium multiflorum]|uniref:RNase H type-1 domain-containing protein n=1 Tax=Lolium multiflorum TaxID=4521 RepID=A0AAD8VHS9_LOLMU|nr:hypothetical protein QYE76_029349 [Lolium multiflorum]
MGVGVGAGVILISPEGDKMKYVLRMNFQLPTNNEAEYEALLHGMRMAKACGATRLEIYGDSNLIVQQSMNLRDAVSDNMIAYHEMYCLMEGKFEGCELKHIGRANNEVADTLATIGSTCSAILDGVFYEEINQCSIKLKPTSPPHSQLSTRGLRPKQSTKTSSSAQTSKFCSSRQFGLSLFLRIYFGKNYPMTQQKHGVSYADLKHTRW